MTVTRANVEAVLVKRCGQLMQAASMDGISCAGANLDMNDPIGGALRRLGYVVASMAAVTDTDVAQVSDVKLDALLDLAEVRVLENVISHLDDATVYSGMSGSSRMASRVRQIQAMVDRKRSYVEREHKLGLGQLEVGVVQFDFVQQAT